MNIKYPLKNLEKTLSSSQQHLLCWPLPLSLRLNERLEYHTGYPVTVALASFIKEADKA